MLGKCLISNIKVFKNDYSGNNKMKKRNRQKLFSPAWKSFDVMTHWTQALQQHFLEQLLINEALKQVAENADSSFTIQPST